MRKALFICYMEFGNKKKFSQHLPIFLLFMVRLFQDHITDRNIGAETGLTHTVFDYNLPGECSSGTKGFGTHTKHRGGGG